MLRVNDLLTSVETHGEQRAARVPKGVLKLAFMEHTSPRLFGTYVWVFLDLRHMGPSGAPSRNAQLFVLVVTLRACGINAETYDEGIPSSESTWKSHHVDLCSTCIKKRSAIGAGRWMLCDGHNSMVEALAIGGARVVTCLQLVDIFCGYSYV